MSRSEIGSKTFRARRSEQLIFWRFKESFREEVTCELSHEKISDNVGEEWVGEKVIRTNLKEDCVVANGESIVCCKP